MGKRKNERRRVGDEGAYTGRTRGAGIVIPLDRSAGIDLNAAAAAPPTRPPPPLPAP